jgi:hypothetical protein
MTIRERCCPKQHFPVVARPGSEFDKPAILEKCVPPESRNGVKLQSFPRTRCHDPVVHTLCLSRSWPWSDFWGGGKANKSKKVAALEASPSRRYRYKLEDPGSSFVSNRTCDVMRQGGWHLRYVSDAKDTGQSVCRLTGAEHR